MPSYARVWRTFLELQDASALPIEVVGEAANGIEAVESARRTQPDVVLLDLVMPQMDGIQATPRILEGSPHTRVVILTSFGEEDKVLPADSRRRGGLPAQGHSAYRAGGRRCANVYWQGAAAPRRRAEADVSGRGLCGSGSAVPEKLRSKSRPKAVVQPAPRAD